jgi:hypothetical protein
MSNLKTEMTSEIRPHSWQGPRRVLYIVFTQKTKNSSGPLVVVGSPCYSLCGVVFTYLSRSHFYRIFPRSTRCPTLIKKKITFSSFLGNLGGSGAKSYMTNDLLIYGENICAFPDILGSPSSYMNLHPILIYEENLVIFFISALYHPARFALLGRVSFIWLIAPVL